MNRWWEKDRAEIYWIEITDRPDIGGDLKTPQRQEDGSEFWGYSLVLELNPGDVVFHYQKDFDSITSFSAVAAPTREGTITWGARGASARAKAVKPYDRPAWITPLTDLTKLENAVSLEQFRSIEKDVRQIKADLSAEHGEPIYFPFAISDKRPLRTQQIYFTKFPAALVRLMNGIQHLAAAVDTPSSPATPGQLGVSYRAADEAAAVAASDPFTVDPAIKERGLRGHATTQNLLAALVKRAGLEPRSPAPSEPDFDLAWSRQERVFVVEVKSLTAANQERQLRLGVGQVLRYRQVLSAGGTPVTAVLAVEKQPDDASWLGLCNELGIALVWPETMENLVRG